MRIIAGTLVAACLLLCAQAQPPAYMPKAKSIQAQAREMQENSRKNPQEVPDFSQPPPKAKAKAPTAPVAKSSKPLNDEVHKAAGTGQLNELQLLESKGYSLTAPDAEQSTPLHLAAYRGQKAVVDYLLSRPGMLKDPIDKRGLSPLMLAAGAGYTDIVDSLLKAGCDFKLKAQDGGTALHRAAAQGHLQVVEKLLEAGCDPSLIDAQGKTALQLAESKKKGDWESVVSRLKQATSP